MGDKMQKLIILLFTTLFTSNILLAASSNLTSLAFKKVFISQVVEHPALNITTKGIIDGLEKNGFKRGVNLDIRIESAQANVALASQISAKFINQNPDVVVGVGTISAQSFIKYAADNKIKMVFSSVTDPLRANLVNALDSPDSNTTGVSNFVDLEPQLKLFFKLQPKLRYLGILYNPGEINSVSIVTRLEVLCHKFGVILVKQTANKTSEVPQAATKLASSVDAIFISNDNTALAALQSIISIANKVKIPIYVSDTDAVELGALAALGPNQYQVGLQTGAMLARILNGKDLSAIPIEFPNEVDLYINEKTANIIDIIIPDSIKEKAAKIIKKDKS